MGQPNQAQALRAHPYLSAGSYHNQADTLAALTQGFGGMNLQHPSYGSSTPRGSHMSAASSEYGGVPVSNHPQTMYMPGAQQLVFANPAMPMSSAQTHGGVHQGMYAPVHYVQQQQQTAQYPGYGQQVTDNSPLTTQWTPRMASGEMPTLITPRRDSISSNEQDLPGTPYTYGGYSNNFQIVDRSPSGVFAHSGTPSPSQLHAPYGAPHLAKPQQQSSLPVHLLALLEHEPRIPSAIPAPSSPLKPLDRSLENKNGETNVYIRGLLPETTDEMLHSWGARFGEIQSSKSIIDLKTNLCKGFGFIKYHNYEDAGNCIRGFHHLGYEVSFARESFYSKLKKFADESNTNLYVSNIPRNMNEHELSQIFGPYKVASARVLRDSSGHGRGVGFARFESRDICEQVIRDYNNKAIPARAGEEEHIIQIRYADTHEQKALKQQTAAARSFRAAEFEYGVAQARSFGLLGPMPMPERASGLTPSEHDAANEFESFLNATAGYVAW
ncbi:hypothetical protein K402DRAFT_335392 [Aulographum hederae CBS 113979]|uniref:RRM domain-containing protein n=1 Tax=Aulographum hederae CBS 113979 TaxID=1176131 RepID=A0A6G1GWF2_9PEZI|nr:hypothetical protein K402DRAFT_335392 [Aulographum hederae CBS 113979]